MKPHVFAGNPFDRGDAQRRDPEWLDAQAKHPQSRMLPLYQLDILVQTEPSFELGWLSPAAVEPLRVDIPPVFLGLQDGIAHFALDVSGVEEPLDKLNLGRRLAISRRARRGWTIERGRRLASWRRAARRLAGTKATAFAASAATRRSKRRGGHVRSCLLVQGAALSPYRPGGHHVNF